MTPSRSRTAKIAGGTLGVLTLCLVVLCYLPTAGAPDAAYEALCWIAAAVGAGGGVGAVAQGARHLVRGQGASE